MVHSSAERTSSNPWPPGRCRWSLIMLAAALLIAPYPRPARGEGPPPAVTTLETSSTAAVPVRIGANDAPADRRHIALEGQPNFRDLGGYPTSDGRSVAWGQVYRSGELGRLSAGDVATLEKLAVRTVVDLRTPEEVAGRGQDQVPAGITVTPLPIHLRDDLIETLLRALETSDFSAVAPDILARVNEDLLTNARAQYAQVIRLVADPTRRPLVVHCTHGKDRAGLASALMLAALGVPWETAREDYLLSNYYRRDLNASELAKIRATIAERTGQAPADVDLTGAEAIFLLKGEYFDAATRLMVEEFGSVENYIREGLGITDAERAKLREQLLHP